MPFTWQITISKSPGGGYAYDPNPLPQVQRGDQIIWTNNDDQPHWPGLLTNGEIDATYFMANQIAAHSTSGTFVPRTAGNLTYVDSLDPTGPTGTIEVSA